MQPTLVQWTILHFTAFMYGFNKTGIVGCGVICTPLMLLSFTAGQTMGILLPLLVIADIVTVIIMRHSVRWMHILKAMPWALTGIIAGWLIARYAVSGGGGGDPVLRKIIAASLVCLMLFGFYLRFNPSLVRGKSAEGDAADSPAERPTKTWFACFMGIMGGVTTMLANNGGPAWVVYLMTLGLSVKEFIGTAAWLFFIQNVTKIPFGVSLGFINRDAISLIPYLLPALGFGLAVGVVTVKRLSKNVFDNVTQFLALAGSLYLLFT